MRLEPRQRSWLVVGALIGAVLGAGTAWLFLQSDEGDLGQPKKPIRPGEMFRFTSQVAGLLREVDDLRRRA